MTTLKIRKVGNSLGTTFPKEILQQLNVEEGDTVYVTQMPDGIKLTAYDPNFAKAMEAYRKVSRKYKNALRELA
jgi:putative addiction module antidote